MRTINWYIKFYKEGKEGLSKETLIFILDRLIEEFEENQRNEPTKEELELLLSLEDYEKLKRK